MTLENVKEVQSALDVMCKYCEQGLCDMCPNRETLRKVKEAYENRKLKECPIIAELKILDIFHTENGQMQNLNIMENYSMKM